MKIRILIGLGCLILVFAGCSILSARESSIGANSGEYQMKPEDFLKKFGVARSEVPRAPEPRLTPMPPLPAKMFQAQRGGWIDFVLRIDKNARVSSVEVVGYSEPNIVIPASAETIRKWWFRTGTKPGLYQLRVTFVLKGPNYADAVFN